MSEPLPHLEVRDLTMAFGSRVVQQDISFRIGRGEIFVIMGDSGCGKSTLMRHMIGLNRPARGDVLYDGEPLWEGDLDAREGLMDRFGVLYQNAAEYTAWFKQAYDQYGQLMKTMGIQTK